MGLEAVARLLEQLLNFLPNIIAALIIFLLGGIAAQFVGNLVTTAAAGAGLNAPGRLAGWYNICSASSSWYWRWVSWVSIRPSW